MEGQDRRTRASRWVPLALGCLGWAAGAGTATAKDASNVRLVHNGHRFAVAQALAGAARQLEHAECQALLDEFVDGAGQPLRAGLELLGFDAPAYLRGGIFFYDAPERACGTASAAVTQPGSRAIFVCGPRFLRETKRSSRHAEALLIHEMLHSLGLGENPPSSDHITARVRARCEGRGPRVGSDTVVRTLP